VKDNESYDGDKIDAKVCDLVNEEIQFEQGTADFGLFLFVLSAISPENYSKVATKLYNQMKPGGVLYFRDYGRYDLA
jgi:SAM-dependent methyltransferase